MEYLEMIAEDLSWFIIENKDKLENISQSQLRKYIFDFLKNQ